ncbi:hypothetical protein BKA64DRAFT_645498 [Cadophora sp. MPI-SDFR-AT-0126]|nr:hypothetical protein BKA64DRAFT_645498 [Leotiomycetes sp. MPI-SDFR-AT-0126]
MTPISLIISVFLCFSSVHSQSPGMFINPSPQPQHFVRFGTDPLSGNAVYTVGNLLNITWVPLESGSMTVVMWQVDVERPKDQIGDLQYLPGSRKDQQIIDSIETILILSPGNLDASHYTWNPIGVDGNNGNPNFDLTDGNVFYFALCEKDGLTPLSMTSFFNLTDSKVNALGQSISVTTSSIISSSPSTTSSTSSFSHSTATIPSSPPATTSAINSASIGTSGSSDLTTGAKVGIGLGVSLGVAILVAILAGIYLLLKRKKATPTSPSVELIAGQTDYKYEMPSAASSPKPRLVSTYGGSSAPMHELPSYQ